MDEGPTPDWQETFLVGMLVTVLPAMLLLVLYGFYSLAGWYVLLLPASLIFFYVVGLAVRKVMKF